MTDFSNLPEEFVEVDFGDNTESQPQQEESCIFDFINAQVSKIACLSLGEKGRLAQLLRRHKAAFGCKYSQVRMSKLTPMEVELVEDAPSTLPAAGRSMGHQQTLFIRQKFADLEDLGLVKPATNCPYLWVSTHYDSQVLLRERGRY